MERPCTTRSTTARSRSLNPYADTRSHARQFLGSRRLDDDHRLASPAVSWHVGGTKAYLRVLVVELRDAGVLAADADVSSFEELLTTLEGTSGALADAVDVPPLDASSVRASWQDLRRQAADLPDAAGLEKTFAELQLAARREDRTIPEISSMVALGAVRAGVTLGNVHVFDYYRLALRTIADEGLLPFLRRTGAPYLTRADAHFDPRSGTHSERLLLRRADRHSKLQSVESNRSTVQVGKAAISFYDG